MKHIRKFNESKNNLLERDDDSITKIVNIIEDTLVEFNIDFKIYLNSNRKDSMTRDERVQDETEYTASVQIDIKYFLRKEEFSQFDSIGNPYSSNDINKDYEIVTSKLNELISVVNKNIEFLNGIKSLHYRLQKSGYIINFFNYNQDKISFCFVVEDEKILIKNER